MTCIKNETASGMATMLFALHPIHAESIYWITAGYDLIFVVLYIGALLAHIRFFHEGKGLRWMSFALATGAIFSNEIALTLPLIIMSIDAFWYKVTIFKKQNSVIYLSYVVIAILFLVLRSAIVADQAFNSRVYVNTVEEVKLAGVLFGNYLEQLTIPVNFSVDHRVQPGLTGLYSQNHNLKNPAVAIDFKRGDVAVSALLAVLWLVAIVSALIKRGKVSVILLWLPLTLLAVLRIIPLPVLYAERYAYLASIGYMLGVAYLINRASKSKIGAKASFVVVALLSMWYAQKSYGMAVVWQSDEHLWSHVLKENNESATAASSLGIHYYLAGDMVKSFEYHQKAVDLNPYMSSFQREYISSLGRLKKYQEVIDFAKKISQTDPLNADLYTLIASSYDELGDYQNAMANYQKAYDLTPKGAGMAREIEKLVTALDQKYHIVDLE
jgi:tetratricopeptide (TPR) repeat protein